MTKLFSASAIAISLVAAMLAVTANASPAPAVVDTGSVTVSYGDLDIGHAAGANALYERIKAASTDACGGAPDIRVLEEATAFNECRKDAITRAVAQVGSPLVWAAADRSPQD